MAGDLCTLFVYGTLKRGFSRAAALDGQRYMGEATSASRYRMVNTGTYPGLIETGEHQGAAVEGELWQVDAACWKWSSSQRSTTQRATVPTTPQIAVAWASLPSHALSQVPQCASFTYRPLTLSR